MPYEKGTTKMKFFLTISIIVVIFFGVLSMKNAIQKTEVEADSNWQQVSNRINELLSGSFTQSDNNTGQELQNPLELTPDQLDQITAKIQVSTSTKLLDTSDWQTYTNEEYKIEFKYPKNWVINKNEYNDSWNLYQIDIQDKEGKYLCLSGGPANKEDYIKDGFSEEGGILIRIMIELNSENLTPEKIKEKSNQSYINQEKNIGEETAVLNGMNEGACSPPVWTIIKNGYLYSFIDQNLLGTNDFKDTNEAASIEDGENIHHPYTEQGLEQYFNTIISTFKFIEE